MNDQTRETMFDAFGRTGLGSVAAAALNELIRVGGGPSPIIAARLAARMGIAPGRVESALRQLINRGVVGRVGRDYQILDTAGWSISQSNGGPGIAHARPGGILANDQAALASAGDR